MKKAISILTALACVTILFSSCGNKMPKVGDIRDIFPEEMGPDIEMPEEIVNQIVDYDESIFGADVNIYYGVSKYSRSFEKSILEKFGLKKSDFSSAIYGTDLYSYKKDAKEVLIDRKDGTFWFSEKCGASDYIYDRTHFDELGEQKLRELDLLPESFCLSGYSLVGGEEWPEEYGPRFAQMIDGVKVKGDGNVGIWFNADEGITGIDFNWLDPIYATTAKTLSFEEAYARIGSEYSYITYELPLFADKMVFDKVIPVYYKDSDCDYYIPMFRFEGTVYEGDKQDEVWAYVIAIEDLTDDMIILQ